MKKNKMEGKYPFEYDIFTFNGSKIRKILLVITLPYFPMSFAIIALEYIRFSWGPLLTTETVVGPGLEGPSLIESVSQEGPSLIESVSQESYCYYKEYL